MKMNTFAFIDNNSGFLFFVQSAATVRACPFVAEYVGTRA